MNDSVDPLSNYWTPQQELAWRETYSPPLAIASLFVCICAQLLFYIFPRLREFPRCVLSWLNYYNMILLVFIIVKWSPYSALHNDMATNVVPGSFYCRISIFMETLSLTGTTSCTTLVCLTLFLVVIFHKDLEEHGKYFWKYLSFAVLYPLCLAISSSVFFRTNWQEGESCKIENEVGNIIFRLPYLINVTIQIFFLATTMKYIRSTASSVKLNVSKTMPIYYVFIRFIATFFAQLINVFPAQIFLTFPHTGNNAIFMRFVIVTKIMGSMMEALVLLFGHMEFNQLLFSSFSRFFSFLFSNCGNREEKEEKEMEMEKIKERKGKGERKVPQIITFSDLRANFAPKEEKDEKEREKEERGEEGDGGSPGPITLRNLQKMEEGIATN